MPTRSWLMCQGNPRVHRFVLRGDPERVSSERFGRVTSQVVGEYGFRIQCGPLWRMAATVR